MTAGYDAPRDVDRLAGDLVRLRSPRPDDLEAVAAIRDHPVSMYYGSPDPPAQWPRQAPESWVTEEPGPRAYRFVVHPLDAPDRIVGTLGIGRIDWKNRNAMLGIGIHPDERRHGYGADAGRVVVRFAFDQLNLVKLYVGVFAFNAPSLALCRSLGFVEEGRLRDERFRDGRWWDEHLLAVWRDDARPGEPGARR